MQLGWFVNGVGGNYYCDQSISQPFQPNKLFFSNTLSTITNREGIQLF